MYAALTIHVSEKKIPYTGKELRSHYLLDTFGLQSHAIAAWRGPCQVSTGDLVDKEDQMQGDWIAAKEMVHFIGEFFHWPLPQAIGFSRLIIACMKDSLEPLLPNGLSVRRVGDDLYVSAHRDTETWEKKLTVSIVTQSNLSSLMHIGINVDASDAPVAAIGLQELGVDVDTWVTQLLEHVRQEWDGMMWACVKVRPVL